MIAYSKKHEKHDVLIFKKAFSTENCEKGIEIFEKYKYLAYKSLNTANEYREGSIIDIDLYDDIPEMVDMCEKYKILISNIISHLKSRYTAIKSNEILFAGIQLIRYSPGEIVKEHADGLFDPNLPPSSSFATMMVYLNKPSEGGGTYFNRQNLIVEPNVGQCLIFPPYHTHTHGSIATTNDNRYILSTWLHLKHV